MIERLQKIISASGLMSRRRAEEYIIAGKVKVNGRIAELGQSADATIDAITVDGRPLPPVETKTYIMLNKPRGYVTTLHDEKDRRDVTQLISEIGVRLYPVGRLDMYSEGLLIMTNDGETANKLMHPSRNIDKTYHTWVSGEDIGLAVEMLRSPMELDGYELSPAKAEILGLDGHFAILSITIHEGRNRQVRRMCELAGLRVTKLCRVSEGGLELGELKPGKWRYLTDEEIRRIRA